MPSRGVGGRRNRKNDSTSLIYKQSAVVSYISPIFVFEEEKI